MILKLSDAGNWGAKRPLPTTSSALQPFFPDIIYSTIIERLLCARLCVSWEFSSDPDWHKPGPNAARRIMGGGGSDE